MVLLLDLVGQVATSLRGPWPDTAGHGVLILVDVVGVSATITSLQRFREPGGHRVHEVVVDTVVLFVVLQFALDSGDRVRVGFVVVILALDVPGLGLIDSEVIADAAAARSRQ